MSTNISKALEVCSAKLVTFSAAFLVDVREVKRVQFGHMCADRYVVSPFSCKSVEMDQFTVKLETSRTLRDAQGVIQMENKCCVFAIKYPTDVQVRVSSIMTTPLSGLHSAQCCHYPYENYSYGLRMCLYYIWTPYITSIVCITTVVAEWRH